MQMVTAILINWKCSVCIVFQYNNNNEQQQQNGLSEVHIRKCNKRFSLTNGLIRMIDRRMEMLESNQIIRSAIYVCNWNEMQCWMQLNARIHISGLNASSPSQSVRTFSSPLIQMDNFFLLGFTHIFRELKYSLISRIVQKFWHFIIIYESTNPTNILV